MEFLRAVEPTNGSASPLPSTFGPPREHSIYAQLDLHLPPGGGMGDFPSKKFRQRM